MSTTRGPRERLLGYYDAVSKWMKPAVRSLVDEPDTVLASGRQIFEGMLDELPYIDRPKHSMASSMFGCAAMLAVFEALRQQNIDAHAWGRAIHSLPVAVPDDGEDAREQERRDAEASQTKAEPNEFVFELVEADEHTARGMNITSCAICHLFGKHDAMQLVLYMCSLDDVMSDAHGQGLRRKGTIALGAKRCDFRFTQGGEPLRIAGLYPEQIRLSEA
jgi:hypothetical protein